MESQKQYYLCLISYLTDRKQYMVYDKNKSDFADIKTGVPQGSVIGPLLSLIYINGFPTACKLFKFLMYDVVL